MGSGLVCIFAKVWCIKLQIFISTVVLGLCFPWLVFLQDVILFTSLLHVLSQLFTPLRAPKFLKLLHELGLTNQSFDCYSHPYFVPCFLLYAVPELSYSLFALGETYCVCVERTLACMHVRGLNKLSSLFVMDAIWQPERLYKAHLYT